MYRVSPSCKFSGRTRFKVEAKERRRRISSLRLRRDLGQLAIAHRSHLNLHVSLDSAPVISSISSLLTRRPFFWTRSLCLVLHLL
mmetsp:Transcript_296/g.694  ORF Transcript_296/g.694 Transcript_296/m.694 type:complete len:85 (-) Transcript_296:1086-1340(-)